MITSKDNEKIKLIRKLENKKARRETGFFLLEGKRLVNEALKRGAAVEVFTTQGANFPGGTLLSDAVFAGVSDTVNSQGVLALCRIPKYEPVYEGCCLILDRVRDPGNLGAIIRTAAAAEIG